MHMIQSNKHENAFLELVRCGLWGTHPNPAFFKDLTQQDWLTIYNIAGKQTVIGICLTSVMDLPDNLKPPTQLVIQWIGLNRYIEANNKKKIQVWKELDTKLTALGFRPVIFKGLSVAKWYSHPLSRQFSDIDLYIPEKFDEVIQMLKASGVECDHKPQHDTIEYKGVSIEIHSQIINVPFKPNFTCSIIEDTINGDVPIRTPDVNTHSILLLSHAADHFMIPGIGYRFLCDWAVFLKQNHNKINTALVLQEADQMGMRHFVSEFTKLAEVQLGLRFEGLIRWTEGSNEKYLERLSAHLFDHGDFGAKNFQKDLRKNTLTFGWNVTKNVCACRYYWPKLFWKKAPIYLVKFNILTMMRRLNIPV